MKVHFLLVGGVTLGLLLLAPNSRAHGGGGFSGGGGNSFHGGGGNSFHGGGRNSFHAGGNWHSGGFHGYGYGRHGYWYHGRFYGPAFGFYGFAYPWWGWDYPYYSGYYGYDPYYNGTYQGEQDPRLNSTRAVQAALAWQGYYNGRIDGVVGPETREAIRAFQAQKGLPVTGRIDSGLIDALRR